MISVINKNLNISLLKYSNLQNSKADLNSLSLNSASEKKQNSYFKIPVNTFKAYTLSFSGKDDSQKIESKHIENVVKSVKEKNFQGLSLYIPEGETKPVQRLQWQKLKWENLKQEPIDWNKAKKEDVLSFWHALSLIETQETTWVNKYNPKTSKAPRATLRSVVFPNPQREHRVLLNQLQTKLNDPNYDYLKKPLLDPKTGEFNVDFTAFDTETTGIKDDDRIIQIGAVKYNADKKTETTYNKFYDPGFEVPEEAVAVHGLSTKILKDEKHNAKPIVESLKEFNNKFAKNTILVAYNANFDIGKINYEIEAYNNSHNTRLHIDKKERCVTVDPYLITQRIHPFLGAKKKLGFQYRFFFGKDIEGKAHDALDDVNATVDMFKYCALYLNKHFTPSKGHKALTVADLLTFQYGGEVKGLNIKLNNYNIDSSKKFDPSYQKNAIIADGFPDGYLMNNENLKNLKDKYSDQLGSDNIKSLEKLNENEAMKKKVQQKKGYSPKTFVRIFRSESYKIKPYEGNSNKKLFNLIIENLPNKKDDFIKTMWTKNVNPWDEGNDLPDMEISRQVILGKQPEDKKLKPLNLQEIKQKVEKGELPDLSHQEDPEYYKKFKQTIEE